MLNKKKVLYGADKTGILALNYFGNENVAYFCDSSPEKIGKSFDGIKCIGSSDLKELKGEIDEVVICSSHYEEIITSLEKIGFYNVRSFGAFLVDSICNNSDKFYVFCLSGIGDTVVVSSLGKHIKEMRGIQHLVLVCKQCHKDIFLMYDAFDECVAVSNEEARLIYKCNERYERTYGKNYIIGNYNHLMKTRWNYNNRLDFFRTCTLQLPPQCMPSEIKKEFILDTHFFELKTDNMVILAPYAVSCQMLPFEFWEKLVEKLLHLGFRVYTNISIQKNEKEIKGSIPLKLSLREIFSLGYEIRCMISMRSGLCDLMANNKELNHIIINPNDGHMGQRDVSVYGSEKITNLEWDGNTERIIDEISKHL